MKDILPRIYGFVKYIIPNPWTSTGCLRGVASKEQVRTALPVSYAHATACSMSGGRVSQVKRASMKRGPVASGIGAISSLGVDRRVRAIKEEVPHHGTKEVETYRQ